MTGSKLNHGRAPTPLTGLACVTRVHADLAIFGIEPGRVVVRNLSGIDFATLASLLDVPLTDATRRRPHNP